MTRISYGYKIVWHEHLDGRGSFGPQQRISHLPNNPTALSIVDLDGDADLDFATDPDIVISGARELELMEAERLRHGKFTL